ncbi:hypothetical protein PspLS_06879 [Pyricularia sp. CBS 133598]|nr:hypothetical protein PspLS_06879 [Pyricularia sp. CBS 133598]
MQPRKPFRKRRQKLQNWRAAMKPADNRDDLSKGFEYSRKTLDPAVGNGLSRLENNPWETKFTIAPKPSTRAPMESSYKHAQHS